MKKVIRNIVISFVLVAMCTINIPSVLYAEDSVVMSVTPDSAFTVDNATGTITDYNVVTGGRDVVIPDTINGITIKHIGDKAFYIKGVTSVVLPANLLTIGEKAFATESNNPNKITSVIFNEGLKSIGKQCFQYNAITKVELPNSITTISEAAFQENEIAKIKFPSALTTIEKDVFNCNKLEKLVIPNTINTIGIYAFAGNFISDLTIPNGVTKIEHSAFYVNELTKVEIPGSVEEIGSYAFSDNRISKVVFNEGLKTIDNGAFETNCLTNFYLPKSVEKIGTDVIKNQKATGSYKTVDGKWQLDFDDWDINFFAGNVLPFANLKLDGKTIAMDLTEHTVKFGSDPIGGTITYDYIPYNYSNPTIKGGLNSVSVILEPFVEKYTVSFDTAGGVPSFESILVSDGGSYGTLPIPTKNGYLFDGWYTAANGGEVKINDHDTVTQKNDHTLFANWIGVDWTVSFETNGANETIANQMIKTNELANQPANPLKNGFVFGGWFEDAALTKPYDFTTNLIMGNTTIYAKWFEEELVVSFDTNGGDTIISDYKYKKGDLLIKPADPTKNGFIFSGWFKDEALTIEFDFATDKVNSVMRLYAKWIPVASDVTPLPSTPDKPALPNNNATINNTDAVNTVDETNGTLYVLTLIIAGIFIIKLASRRNKAI